MEICPARGCAASAGRLEPDPPCLGRRFLASRSCRPPVLSRCPLERLHVWLSPTWFGWRPNLVRFLPLSATTATTVGFSIQGFLACSSNSLERPVRSIHQPPSQDFQCHP